MEATGEDRGEDRGEDKDVDVVASVGVVRTLLGVGGFADVYKDACVMDAETIAFAEKVDRNPHCKYGVREQKALSELSLHGVPNVVRLYSWSRGRRKLELCDGDVVTAVENTVEKRLSEDVARPLIRGALQGLADCHRLGVFHGDVKAENILLKDGVAKLADFGHATVGWQPLSDRRYGSLYYAAPETFTGDVYNMGAADVWAMGIVLLVCVVGRFPWDSLKRGVDCKEFRLWRANFAGNRVPDPHVAHKCLAPETTVTPIFIQAVTAMLHPSPACRPTAEQALSLSFFAEPVPVSDVPPSLKCTPT